jgi:hypothetical protein
MKITPPSTPPPPLTAEEQALVETSKRFLESMKDRPPVSEGLQERASENATEADEESDDAPLI